MKSIAHSDR